MKKTFILIVSTIFAFSFLTSCKKKEDKKTSVDNAMAVDMAEPKPEEPMKEEPKKPEPQPVPAAESVTPPTITQFAELGVPKVAVYVNFAKMVESPLFKEMGLVDKMNVSFFSDMKDKEKLEKMATCLGIDIKNPTHLFSKAVVFSDGTETNILAILDLPVETEKMMGCVKEIAKKDIKFEEVTIGGAKGTKVIKDKQEVTVVSVDKNKALMVVGEQKDFVAKLKIGEGNIGKGDVDGYFPGGPHCVKVVVRNLDVTKMASKMMPNVKTIDLDAMVGLMNGLNVDVKIDTKDAKAAETISSLMTVGKNHPELKKNLKNMGLNENLIDKVNIAAKDTVVTVSLAFDIETVKSIAEKLKDLSPQTPSSAAPAAEDMKSEDMKADAK